MLWWHVLQKNRWIHSSEQRHFLSHRLHLIAQVCIWAPYYQMWYCRFQRGEKYNHQCLKQSCMICSSCSSWCRLVKLWRHLGWWVGHMLHFWHHYLRFCNHWDEAWSCFHIRFCLWLLYWYLRRSYIFGVFPVVWGIGVVRGKWGGTV